MVRWTDVRIQMQDHQQTRHHKCLKLGQYLLILAIEGHTGTLGSNQIRYLESLTFPQKHIVHRQASHTDLMIEVIPLHHLHILRLEISPVELKILEIHRKVLYLPGRG